MASFTPRLGISYEIPKGYTGVTEGKVMLGDLNWDPAKNSFTPAPKSHVGEDVTSFYAVVRKTKQEYKTTIDMNNNISILGTITKIPKGYMIMIGNNIIVQEGDLFFTRDTYKWVPINDSQTGIKSRYDCLARKRGEQPKIDKQIVKEKPKSRLARIATKR